MDCCYSGDHIAGNHIHLNKEKHVTFRNHSRSTAMSSVEKMKFRGFKKFSNAFEIIEIKSCFTSI